MSHKHRSAHTKYYFPTVETKDYIDMTDEQNCFNHPVEKMI